MPTAGHLVWIKLEKPKKDGPQTYAEKWPLDAPTGAKNGKTVVASYALEPDEYAMKIAILEQRYPPPHISESAS